MEFAAIQTKPAYAGLKFLKSAQAVSPVLREGFPPQATGEPEGTSFV